MLQIIGLRNIPLIKPGDDLGKIIHDSLTREGIQLSKNDILVVTQKIVSKAEDRIVTLDDVTPSPLAQNISRYTGRDTRLTEVILSESKRVVRMKGTHLITEHKTGYICANAGVDHSNVDQTDSVTLLPENPDLSASALRKRIKELSGADVAVIISDTSGRPFRIGQTNIAIGSAGISPIRNYKNTKDMFGRPLTVTAIAVIDELASAAELVMNKIDQTPVALLRGYRYRPSTRGASTLNRPADQDLFS